MITKFSWDGTEGVRARRPRQIKAFTNAKRHSNKLSRPNPSSPSPPAARRAPPSSAPPSDGRRRAPRAALDRLRVLGLGVARSSARPRSPFGRASPSAACRRPRPPSPPPPRWWGRPAPRKPPTPGWTPSSGGSCSRTSKWPPPTAASPTFGLLWRLWRRARWVVDLAVELVSTLA